MWNVLVAKLYYNLINFTNKVKALLVLKIQDYKIIKINKYEINKYKICK